MSAPALLMATSDSLHALIEVEPPEPCGGVDLRILAGDLVGRDGLPRRLSQLADDVEVEAGGLDHHDVGALGLVEPELDERLAAVRRIELVGALVEHRRSRALGGSDGVAEGPVVGRGILCRVGHDRGPLVVGRVEGLPDRPHPPVHHVARRHEIDARLGMEDRHLAQDRDRPVVVDVPPVGRKDPVVAVDRIGVEGDVGHDHHLRERLLHGLYGAQDQRVLAKGGGPLLVLERGAELREKGDGHDAKLAQLAAFADEVGQVKAEDARHGGNGFGPALPVDHEERGRSGFWAAARRPRRGSGWPGSCVAASVVERD